PPDDAISASYCWCNWPLASWQTLLLIRVPPSMAQFVDPESLSGAVDAPARETPNANAAAQATSTKHEPTTAAAALCIPANLRIGLLSASRATLRTPGIRSARRNGFRQSRRSYSRRSSATAAGRVGSAGRASVCRPLRKRRHVAGEQAKLPVLTMP